MSDIGAPRSRRSSWASAATAAAASRRSTAAFYELLGADRITTVCLDDYHSLDRRERALIGVTPLNPRANNFALMEEQLWTLKRGEAIAKPVYDHADGTFKPPERVAPNEVVIVQGLHPFLLPGIREAFDLKVWLDPDPGCASSGSCSEISPSVATTRPRCERRSRRAARMRRRTSSRSGRRQTSWCVSPLPTKTCHRAAATTSMCV